MTAQFNDLFQYQGKLFAIAGISTGELFRPADFGLNPIQASTACWRGYMATFAIADSYLVLNALYVNLDVSQAPTIHGVAATGSTDRLQLFSHMYSDLTYRLHYTGGLLLGYDFLQELYVHMGFHPAWKYRTVFELTFEDGRLTGELERSDWAAQKRHEFLDSARKDKPDRMPTKKEISEFVEDAFDRSYEKDGNDRQT